MRRREIVLEQVQGRYGGIAECFSAGRKKVSCHKSVSANYATLFFISRDLPGAIDQRICYTPRNPVVRVASLLIGFTVFACFARWRVSPQAFSGAGLVPPTLSASPLTAPSDPDTPGAFDNDTDACHIDAYFSEDPLDDWEQQVVQFGPYDYRPRCYSYERCLTLRPGIYIARKNWAFRRFTVHTSFTPINPASSASAVPAASIWGRGFIHHCAYAIAVNRRAGRRSCGVIAAESLRCFDVMLTERPENFDCASATIYIRRQSADTARSQNHDPAWVVLTCREKSIPSRWKGLALAQQKNIHMVFLTWGMEVPYFHNLAQ